MNATETTNAPVCPCDNLTITCNLRVAGEARIARDVRLQCPQCGTVWDIQRIGSKNELLMQVKSPAHQKPRKPKTPKPPSPEEQRAREDFNRLLGEWQSANGSASAQVGWQVVGGLSKLKPGVQILGIGSEVGLIGLALNQTPDAGPHAVVADDETITRLSPLVTRCDVHPFDWSPTYGTLYTGIVLSGDVPPEWINRVPTLLKPAGDCWLVGDAQRHAEALSAVWGYKPRTLNAGQPDQYVFFLGTSAPLGEGPGTELHHDLSSRGMPECQTCRRLAHEMNAWGVDGCREHFEEIVEDILPRARNWWLNTGHREKLKAWWQGESRLWSAFTTGASLATHEIDDTLRTIISQRVRAAIDSAGVLIVDQEAVSG